MPLRGSHNRRAMPAMRLGKVPLPAWVPERRPFARAEQLAASLTCVHPSMQEGAMLSHRPVGLVPVGFYGIFFVKKNSKLRGDCE